MTPYFDRFGVTLWQGDALSVLAALPAASVQCCVTSPPYFGLRSYNTDPLVWDGDPACEHAWEGSAVKHAVGNNIAVRGRDEQSATIGGWSKAAEHGNQHNVVAGATCARCGCWRGELGSEPTPDLYVRHLVAIFAAVRRVLRADGVCWVNIGDSFAANRSQQVPDSKHRDVGNNGSMRAPDGVPPKNLLLVPFRLALALQADGWVIRQTVIWKKVSPMPESVTDRPTTSHEYVFLLAKGEQYFYDALAIAEPSIHAGRVVRASGGDAKNAAGSTSVNDRRTALGFTTHDTLVTATRNARSVWELSPSPFSAAKLGIDDCDHFATMPLELARRCLAAGTSERGACPACGAPWERVIGERAKFGGSAARPNRGLPGRTGNGHSRARAGWSASETTGWRPTCTCPPAEPVPCVVMDIFAGSGTTLRAAQRLGRRAVGIELSADYCRIAEARVGRQGPLDFAPDARPLAAWRRQKQAKEAANG